LSIMARRETHLLTTVSSFKLVSLSSINNMFRWDLVQVL
jgi:hypothetical protein